MSAVFKTSVAVENKMKKMLETLQRELRPN